jgi:hypothetical protein
MASSSAEYRLSNGTNTVIYVDTLSEDSAAIPDIADGTAQEFNFSFADTGIPNQTMPTDTTVAIEISSGEIIGQTSYLVGNNNSEGFSNMNFFVINPAESTPEIAVLTITITTPKGVVTSLIRSISLL